ncbi:MAG: hypothetical protein GSR86_04415 [Desulfurococcales archaeon]|nr:hypothetical protein [Desulfurococcales archaeon]
MSGEEYLAFKNKILSLLGDLEKLDFMANHEPRLREFYEAWAGQGIEVAVVGDYVIAYSPKAVDLAYDILSRSGVWSVIKPIAHLHGHEYFGYMLLDAVLDIEKDITTLRLLRTDVDLRLYGVFDNIRNVGAVIIIGLAEDGKVFVHPLPWFIAALFKLVDGILDEDLVRTLMGFDSHPWEEPVGAIRIQGDIVVKVLETFDTEEDALARVALERFTDTLAMTLVRAELAIAENTYREVVALYKPEYKGWDTGHLATLALARSIHKVLGVIEESNPIDSLTPHYISPIPTLALEPVRLHAYSVSLTSPFHEDLIEPPQWRDDCISDKVCEFISRLLYRLQSTYLITRSLIYNRLGIDSHVIVVDGMPVRLDTQSIFMYITDDARWREYIGGLAVAYLKGRRVEARNLFEEWLFQELYSSPVEEPEEMDIYVLGHIIRVKGIVLGTLATRRYIIYNLFKAYDRLIELIPVELDLDTFFKELPSMDPKFRRQAIEVLVQLLSPNLGDTYLIVFGGEIKVTHLEHGEYTLYLEKPALVKLTTLNTVAFNNPMGIPERYPWQPMLPH